MFTVESCIKDQIESKLQVPTPKAAIGAPYYTIFSNLILMGFHSMP
jgi:hypothetical protein